MRPGHPFPSGSVLWFKMTTTQGCLLPKHCPEVWLPITDDHQKELCWANAAPTANPQETKRCAWRDCRNPHSHYLFHSSSSRTYNKAVCWIIMATASEDLSFIGFARLSHSAGPHRDSLSQHAYLLMIPLLPSCCISKTGESSSPPLLVFSSAQP